MWFFVACGPSWCVELRGFSGCLVEFVLELAQCAQQSVHRGVAFRGVWWSVALRGFSGCQVETPRGFWISLDSGSRWSGCLTGQGQGHLSAKFQETPPSQLPASKPANQAADMERHNLENHAAASKDRKIPAKHSPTNLQVTRAVHSIRIGKQKISRSALPLCCET